MATFRIGQRVKVARGYPLDHPRGEVYEPNPHCYVGCEAVVMGTMKKPNPGFAPEFGDYSVQPIGYWRPGMVLGSMLEALP